ISAARLDFVAVAGTDFYSAEAAILNGVGGNIADVVLAAQLLRDLIKRRFELFCLVPDFDHAATGLNGQPFHLAVSAVAAEAIESAIGAQQNIHNCIGLLRRFNGIAKPVLAALV